MDDGNFSPNSTFGAFAGTAMDSDFMDELLLDGCWLETTDAFDFLQSGPSGSGPVENPSQYVPYSDGNTGHLGMSLNPHQQAYQEETKRKFTENPSIVYPKIEELPETHTQNRRGFDSSISSSQSASFLVQGNELGKKFWIPPRANSEPSSSVTERLVRAIAYLSEYMKDGNALVQIWVPVKRGGKQVLTTDDQPYSLDLSCKSLESYRNVSTTYQFAVDEDCKEFDGLPSRVFMGKLPEWTPDVRFFRRDEYRRVNYAQQYDVQGSLALPVFERGSGTCLGVVEIVTTSQKIHYRPDLENIRIALEAFDLRSSDVSNSRVKDCNVMPEIVEVLRTVCETHNLPLALTWAPCGQQGKGECVQSDDNYADYLLTVDSACFVADQNFLNFLIACSEHQLFEGQGIVGKAFKMSKQCFAANITAFSKSDYPLSHHARMFGLHAALAVPLRHITTGVVEFVLELFLPKECQAIDEQKRMVNSLSIVIQQLCQSLPLAVENELVEVILPIGETGVTADGSSPLKEASSEQSSWISHVIEAQHKGKCVAVSWEYQNEDPKEEFKVTTDWDDGQGDSYHNQVFPGFGQFQHNSGAKISIEDGGDSSSPGVRHSVGSRKTGDKRRIKTEKTISLQVLRQYFAGSLKDAATSIGVCPTTLKRICRQHGITRWPSRKIKKVGHSLRKLQLVIDSVQGAEGAIQIGSFYTSFPELSSPNFSGNGLFSSTKTDDHLKPSNLQPDNGTGAAVSKSPSSSCSQSSGSSTCCSTGATHSITTINALSTGESLMVDNTGGMLKRARSDAELHALNQEEPKVLARSQSYKVLGERASPEPLPPLPKCDNQSLKDRRTFRVKAAFGEEKVRFSLKPNWGFNDLQQEIVRRFNIEDSSKIDLKYLDDDNEWVLLTCDADLEECIDIYKSSQNHTIKITIHVPSHLKFEKFIHRNPPP